MSRACVSSVAPFDGSRLTKSSTRVPGQAAHAGLAFHLVVATVLLASVAHSSLLLFAFLSSRSRAAQAALGYGT